MVLFSLQHGSLRSNMTDHTTMVASRNKFRSTQIPRMIPKQRLWLKSLFLHFLISFLWRNVHRFVSRGRTHNRHKIRSHNMIATNNIFFLTIGLAIQILGMHLKSFIFTFKIINKFVRQNKFSIQVHIQTFKLFQLFTRIFSKFLIFFNQFVGFIELTNQIILFTNELAQILMKLLILFLQVFDICNFNNTQRVM